MAEPVPKQTSPADAPAAKALMDGSKPKVLYVMGAGRSGTTILGITLGNCEGMLYAGELDKWLRRSGKPPLGGEERERFWGEVRENVALSPELAGKAARSLEQTSAPFRPRKWRGQRRLRGPYRRFAEDLYRVVAQTAGVTHVIDTSHFPRRARELQKLDGIELYLLFAVRDPQSVVASWDREDVVEPRFRPGRTNAYLWVTYLMSLRVFCKQPRARRLLVRHEDFVSDPQAVLKDIFECVGSSSGMPNFSALETGVPFQGNRVARSEVVSLNGRAARTTRTSALTAVLQLPWQLVFSRLGPRAGARARR